MTLRELLSSLDCSVKCPDELQNMDITNPFEFCKQDLNEYFYSSRFQDDIQAIVDLINLLKEKGDYDFPDFFVFFTRRGEKEFMLKADLLKF